MTKRRVGKRAIRKSDRDDKGRFVKGEWSGGPGNPQMKMLWPFRRAIAEAVTPEMLVAVVLKLIHKAKRGDVMAAKVVLDRILGKTERAPDDSRVTAIDLPQLKNAHDVVEASSAIMNALSEGKISSDDALKLANVVEMARRAIETHDLAQRVELLEREGV